jgi:hypothetical protein
VTTTHLLDVGVDVDRLGNDRCNRLRRRCNRRNNRLRASLSRGGRLCTRCNNRLRCDYGLRCDDGLRSDDRL